MLISDYLLVHAKNRGAFQIGSPSPLFYCSCSRILRRNAIFSGMDSVLPVQKKTVPAGMAGTVWEVCGFLADNDFFRFGALTANQNLATLRIVDLQALEIVILRLAGAGDGRNSLYSGAGGERYCKTL